MHGYVFLGYVLGYVLLTRTLSIGAHTRASAEVRARVKSYVFHLGRRASIVHHAR